MALQNLEKTQSNVRTEERDVETGDGDTTNSIEDNPPANDSRMEGLWHKLTHRGAIESNGIQPVPEEERNDVRVFNIFTVWFTLSTNLLPIVTGMVGTLSYGLSLRDAALIILFFCMLCTVPTAYLATLGPKTGMRQMVQARFSFGYYLVSIPVILNLATLTGFVIIDSVIGGLTLSSVTSGSLTPTIGIVIVDILALLIAFCGFRILHQYERYAWIPALIALVVATGCGGSHLRDQAPTEPATAQTVLSFAGLVAGFLIPCAYAYSGLSVGTTLKWPSIGSPGGPGGRGNSERLLNLDRRINTTTRSAALSKDKVTNAMSDAFRWDEDHRTKACRPLFETVSTGMATTQSRRVASY